MDARRLFSRGGQKNFGKVAKSYYFPKKNTKNIIFSSKKSKQKHTILPGQRGWVGARALSCPPLRTPVTTVLDEANE